MKVKRWHVRQKCANSIRSWFRGMVVTEFLLKSQLGGWQVAGLEVKLVNRLVQTIGKGSLFGKDSLCSGRGTAFGGHFDDFGR
jgi:hypothetical protein